ncbi:hypothetical protein HHI36_022316 [Cryptolaemus montrouzieri]|uniref:Uncharacterized protein n=1 Tax=Cryptolaemus montrouzieri TaxID=559131 RepID=A0ABD2MZQ7_9CUCU
MSTLPRTPQEDRAFAIRHEMLTPVYLKYPPNCSANGRHEACVFDKEWFGWKCCKRNCQMRSRSLPSGSFFSGARITIHQVIYSMYSFEWDDSYRGAIHKNPIIGTTSGWETVADW